MNCGCSICKNNKPFELPNEIVEAAIKGELVLFCGAGISTEGKNVLPFSFYSSIQEELGVEDNSISFSSLMQQYCNQPNGRKKLLKKIRERFQYIHSFAELERQATNFIVNWQKYIRFIQLLLQTGIHILNSIVVQFRLQFQKILPFGMNVQDLFLRYMGRLII